MDVALYVGLTVACVVIGGLAFFLAKLLRRKGRDHSLYSMARNGKHFIDGKKKRKKENALTLHERRSETRCSVTNNTPIIKRFAFQSSFVKNGLVFRPFVLDRFD